MDIAVGDLANIVVLNVGHDILLQLVQDAHHLCLLEFGGQAAANGGQEITPLAIFTFFPSWYRINFPAAMAELACARVRCGQSSTSGRTR